MKLAPARALPLLLLLTACAGGAGPTPDTTSYVSDADAAAFSQRIEAFYGALQGVPLDALITYESKGLRDCFESPQAFSDYFSALATAARLQSFRYTTARSVQIREFGFQSPDDATVYVAFISVNQRVLRFWSISFDRLDSWHRGQDGVWRIVPAKL